MTAQRKRVKRPAKPLQSFGLTASSLSLTHPDPLKQKAIAAYLKHGTVVAACAAAHCGRTTWYEWLNTDDLFNRLVVEAHENLIDLLEAEARKRAIAGSDTLLIWLLKCLRRGLFGDKERITEFSAELTLKVQQQLQLIASKPSWDSEELISRLSIEVWNK